MLYNNREGYTNEALRIMCKIELYFEELFNDYPEHSLLELKALAIGGLESAYCGVSISNRLRAAPCKIKPKHSKCPIHSFVTVDKCGCDLSKPV